VAGSDLRNVRQSGKPWWSWPALVLDALRPGLAEQAARDVAWLARAPVGIRSLALPVGVVAIPLLFAATRAFDTVGHTPVVVTLRIQDIYTESIPYMVIGASIGILAPTLGVLFLIGHMVGDLIAAFIQPKELSPLPTAILGRLVSFWVLYLLVVELPIAVHEVVASVKPRLKGAAARLGPVLIGVAAATFLAWIWGVGATLFIRPVFTWSDLRFPTSNAGWALLYGSDLFAYAVGAISVATLGLRYVIRPVANEPPVVEAEAQRPGLRSLFFGVVVPILLFSSVINTALDAVVLVVAVIAARPISSIVLRRFALARPLAVIPRPVRLMGGVVLSIAVGYVIASVMGVSQVSPFFTMIVAMAASFILVRILLDADDFASADIPAPSLAATVGSALAMGLVIWLFSAGWAFADNIAGQTDGWGTAAAAAGAAGGAGGLAAMSAKKNNQGKKPNPPPWYIPDSMGEFFGYDGPPKPPVNPKKQPDWTKPKDPKPGDPVY
jgi:hypothetical protein